MAELIKTSLYSSANLLAYYRLENGALTTDSKGAYTLTNNNSVGEGIGIYGGCADFGNSNTNKSLSTTDAMGLSSTDALSLSFWVKLNTEISTGTYTFLNKQIGGTNWAQIRIEYEYNSGTRRLVWGLNSSGGYKTITETITLGTNTWYNLTLTFAGGTTGTITAYRNANSKGTTTAAISGTGASTLFSLGSLENASNWASALIDDVAVFNRVLTQEEITLLYNPSYTPTTYPYLRGRSRFFLNNSVSNYIDPSLTQYGIDQYTKLLLHNNFAEGNDEYTKLLLHCDGTNGSTTFADNSNNRHTVTANGNAQISTAQYKFGGASGYFDGNGDYLSVTTNADFNFGTGDFTIDLWTYVINHSSTRTILSKYTTWTSNLDFIIYVHTNGAIRFRGGNNASIAIDSDSSISVNTWVHIAITRYSGVTKMFINGTSQTGTHTGSVSIANNTTTLKIGINSYNTEDFYGYIDELRISKGIARWTSNFTPPTSAYSNLFLDSSSSSHTVTPYGNTQISTAQYKFGGASGLFDGNGDYLSIPDSDDWDIWNNSFTIDFWYYRLDANGHQLVTQAVNDITYFTTFVGGLANNYRLQTTAVSSGVHKGSFYTSGTLSWELNTWYHIAFVNNNGTFLIFRDGVSLATTIEHSYSATMPNLSAPLEVGRMNISGYYDYLNGYIDELRISKGIARWTSNFTPPERQYGIQLNNIKTKLRSKTLLLPISQQIAF